MEVLHFGVGMDQLKVLSSEMDQAENRLIR